MPNPYDPMMQRMQMPRGTGFAEQGGYQGQVYNTPQQPQPMAQPMPRPMQSPMPQPMGNPMQPQQLTPEQIIEFRQLMQRQRLEQAFKQEQLRGMLSE